MYNIYMNPKHFHSGHHHTESSSDSSSEDQGCENEYEADMLDDAKKYAKALQNTLQFVTCGVCGYEDEFVYNH